MKIVKGQSKILLVELECFAAQKYLSKKQVFEDIVK